MSNHDPHRPFAKLEFATYLDKAMEDAKLSPKQVYEKTLINERSIRAWRTGERLPQISQLEILAQAINRPQDELVKALVESSKQKSSRTKSPKFLNPLNVESHLVESEKLPINSDKKVVRGLSELNQSMIYMVESLERTDNINSEILVVFQSKDRVFTDEARNRWHQALGKAIKNGWTVHQITQVAQAGRDVNRVLFAVSNILRFVDNSDKYNLYKFRQKGSPIAAHGMLIIPGKSAFISMATQNSDCIDLGIHLRVDSDNDQIEAYRARFELLKQQAEVVYEKFDSYQQPKILAAFSKCDQESGDRTVVLKRISEITRPAYFYKPDSDWAKALQKHYNFTDEQIKDHIEARKRRHDELMKRLNTSRYRYIYCKSLLDEFVQTGRVYPFYFEASLQQRLDQLKELKNLLLNSKNFEIALAEEEEEESILNIKPTFCEVKDGILTVMEVPYHDIEGKLGHKWFLIKDSTITAAFQEHLSQLWDRLKVESKDQMSVLRWITQKINTLEDRIRFSGCNVVEA
jgi:hypothetical protein